MDSETLPLPDEEQVQSFVIRLWRESGGYPGEPPEWRGRVIHVQSGRHTYFRDLATLVRFLRQQIGWPEPLVE